MYLAKGYPNEETIEEHTDNLICNFYLLKKYYGDKININWDLLKLACLYHDIGKVNRVFQARIKSDYIDSKFPNIPHGYLSVLFINYKKIMEEYNLNINELIILINAVAHHHKRSPLDDDMKRKIEEYHQYLEEDIEKFYYKELGELGQDINKVNLRIVSKSGILGLPKDLVESYILIKGLLNKIDYAASGHYTIEYPNNFLLKSMENIKEKWGKDADFNRLQKYMLKNSDYNIIAIAETGYGKTEAGLLWIGNNKGFFTLPLKSAINQIYKRISEDIIIENLEERLGLLHSDTLLEYVKKNNDIIDEELLDYQEITNELSMPLTICTIDQIFDFVYKYIGFERKLATLSYSKIVIDEIQMYSADLVAYIVIALNQINNIGGKFSIITATFPPFIKDLLVKNNIEFKMPKPFIYNDRIRHSIEIIREEISAKYIYSKYNNNNNKILVIVNTVNKLIELYHILIDNYDIADYVNVFHSGFTKQDRRKKEEEIVNFGNRNNKESGIWICTQVAEASLDIDFDILITELSDLNGLFQRMGRCYRNRSLDTNYNVYIFDGGDKLCSGIGYVNDKDIYNMSKDILRSRGNGIISEKEKIALINKVYSTDSIRETKYYNKILNTIDYINSINYYEFNEKDVDKYFRNINSINVIPRPVYEKNKYKIERLIKILSKDIKKECSNKKDLYIERKIARLKLDEFKLSIPYYYIKHTNCEVININKYDTLNIYSCEYSSEYGINHLSTNEEKEEDIFF